MASAAKVILASGSPRRRQLLAAQGIEFEAAESGVPEVPAHGESPRAYALRLAEEKALAVSARNPGALVVGADTTVVCGGELLEKPASPADARRMLKLLSGRTHIVVTAFAIARDGAILESAPVESAVTFRVLTDEEIDAYVATGDPFDKAGAYGIQSIGAGFVTNVEGSRDNVMGLPAARVAAALVRHGAIAK
ncbi:MAG: Maf family protein [Candidatus Binataceae bacterium]